MEIFFEGMDKLIANLGEMRLSLTGPEAKKAVRAGARVIRDAMRNAAPVLDKKTAGSSSLDPGAMKAGIRSYVSTKEAEPIAYIGPKAEIEHIARFVEYGHRNVKGGYSKVTPTGTQGPGKASDTDTPAHPFLRPAFESSIEAADAAMQESLSQSLKKAQGL